MLIRKLLLPLIFAFVFTSIKAQNINVSDYCPGTPRDFSTSFGPLAPGVTFTWTVAASNNVKNFAPQSTASPTVTQNIGLTNPANPGVLALRVTASDLKIYNLTINIQALPYINNKSNTAHNTSISIGTTHDIMRFDRQNYVSNSSNDTGSMTMVRGSNQTIVRGEKGMDPCEENDICHHHNNNYNLNKTLNQSAIIQWASSHLILWKCKNGKMNHAAWKKTTIGN